MDSQTVARPGFSRRDDTQAGTFHYLLGLVAFRISPKAQDALKRIGKGEVITANDGDEDSLLEMAQEIFGLIHEMRHFVDAFGTLSGWSLVNRRIELLQRFARLSEALNAAGMHWKLPLADWAMAPDCPDVIALSTERIPPRFSKLTASWARGRALALDRERLRHELG
jgi:hypothetical protein